jgi:hypothetical protein
VTMNLNPFPCRLSDKTRELSPALWRARRALSALSLIRKCGCNVVSIRLQPPAFNLETLPGEFCERFLS